MKRALRTKSVGTKVSEVELRVLESRAAAAGSRLVFYSDGITEAENPADEEYGWARLQQHFLRTDASAESLLDDVRSFANGPGPR